MCFSRACTLLIYEVHASKKADAYKASVYGMLSMLNILRL